MGVFLLAERVFRERALIAMLDAELGAAGGQGPEVALLYVTEEDVSGTELPANSSHIIASDISSMARVNDEIDTSLPLGIPFPQEYFHRTNLQRKPTHPHANTAIASMHIPQLRQLRHESKRAAMAVAMISMHFFSLLCHPAFAFLDHPLNISFL